MLFRSRESDGKFSVHGITSVVHYNSDSVDIIKWDSISNVVVRPDDEKFYIDVKMTYLDAAKDYDKKLEHEIGKEYLGRLSLLRTTCFNGTWVKNDNQEPWGFMITPPWRIN